MEKELENIIRQIAPPDTAAMDAARKRQGELAKPPGSLGRLEDLSIQMAGITGKVFNHIEKKHLLVFAKCRKAAVRLCRLDHLHLLSVAVKPVTLAILVPRKHRAVHKMVLNLRMLLGLEQKVGANPLCRVGTLLKIALSDVDVENADVMALHLLEFAIIQIHG